MRDPYVDALQEISPALAAHARFEAIKRERLFKEYAPVNDKITTITPQWWDKAYEPKVRRLAETLCRKAGHIHDGMVLPYEPAVCHFPSGLGVWVRPDDLRPAWTLYTTIAVEALAARDEMEIDDVLGEKQTELPESEALFTDSPEAASPDETWRQEKGLDAQGQD